jgi:hypothetical protein
MASSIDLVQTNTFAMLCCCPYLERMVKRVLETHYETFMLNTHSATSLLHS